MKDIIEATNELREAILSGMEITLQINEDTGGWFAWVEACELGVGGNTPAEVFINLADLLYRQKAGVQ